MSTTSSPGSLSKMRSGTSGNCALNAAKTFSCASSAIAPHFKIALIFARFRSDSSISDIRVALHSEFTNGQPWLIVTGILPYF